MVKAVKPLLHLLVHKTKLSTCRPSHILNSSCEMESYPPRHRTQPGRFSREDVSSNSEAVISASTFTVIRNRSKTQKLPDSLWQDRWPSQPLIPTSRFCLLPRKAQRFHMLCFLHHTVTPLARNGPHFKKLVLFQSF